MLYYNTTSRNYILLNKNSNAQHEYLSMKCWSQTLQRAPKAKPIAVAFICAPELDGKTLLLKSPHTSVTGSTAIKSELSWKLTSFYSARRSYANHGGRRAINGLTQQWTLPVKQDAPTGATVGWLAWGNQPLSSWVSGPQPLRDFIPSTEKQTNKNKQTLPKAHGLGSQRHWGGAFYWHFAKWTCCQTAF